MNFAIIRGANGRRHEVDFGEGEIAISLQASGVANRPGFEHLASGKNLGP